METAKYKALKRIFKILDSDRDGKISVGGINVDSLPKEIRDLFKKTHYIEKLLLNSCRGKYTANFDDFYKFSKDTCSFSDWLILL